MYRQNSNEDDPSDPRKKILLIRNGKPNKRKMMRLRDNLGFDQICKEIAQHMDIKYHKNVRLFKQGGVELLEEDIGYIDSDDMLFVSKGENFDESSNFAIYEKKQVLGQGGFGTVFYGVNKITKKSVAIKIVSQKRMRKVEEVQTVFKEIEALRHLDNEHILKIQHCYFLREEQSFGIILEYLEGGDLKSFLKEQEKQYIEEERAQKIFSQLVEGMSYCHNHKIIHRDLKLENLMFSDKEKNFLKIVDFGIAGIDTNNGNAEHTNAGSLRYLAPEVISFRAKANPSIDIWGMGVILYYILTGRPPFNGSTRQEIQEKILKGNFQFLEEDNHVTDAGKDLIKRMLVVDVKNRYAMHEIKEHPWLNHPIPVLREIQANREIQEIQNKEAKRQQELKKKIEEQQRRLERRKVRNTTNSVGPYSNTVSKTLKEKQNMSHQNNFKGSRNNGSISQFQDIEDENNNNNNNLNVFPPIGQKTSLVDLGNINQNINNPKVQSESSIGNKNSFRTSKTKFKPQVPKQLVKKKSNESNQITSRNSIENNIKESNNNNNNNNNPIIKIRPRNSFQAYEGIIIRKQQQQQQQQQKNNRRTSSSMSNRIEEQNNNKSLNKFNIRKKYLHTENDENVNNNEKKMHNPYQIAYPSKKVVKSKNNNSEKQQIYYQQNNSRDQEHDAQHNLKIPQYYPYNQFIKNNNNKHVNKSLDYSRSVRYLNNSNNNNESTPKHINSSYNVQTDSFKKRSNLYKLRNYQQEQNFNKFQYYNNKNN